MEPSDIIELLLTCLTLAKTPELVNFANALHRRIILGEMPTDVRVDLERSLYALILPTDRGGQDPNAPTLYGLYPPDTSGQPEDDGLRSE